MFDAEDADVVGEVLQAVANPHRLRLLHGLYTGRSRQELAADLPISGSGVTNHLRVLADADLIYRGEEGWQVSPLGGFFAVFLEEHVDVIADAARRIEAAAAEAEEEYTDVPMPDEERARTVEWRKWELVRSELESLLEDVENTE